MTDPHNNYALRAWLAIWRFWQGYFHYEVDDGIKQLEDKNVGYVVVGYHGRPIAFDMCILQTILYEKLGYLPPGILHKGIGSLAPTRWLFLEQLGFFAGEKSAAIDEWLREKHHVFITPGGDREALRTAYDHNVDWGNRKGYLRVAKRNGVKIIPVAAAGVDRAYMGLTNAHDLAKSIGVGADLRWLLWGGVGMLGVYPFAPPFPVRIYQKIGKPISVDQLDINDPDAVDQKHKDVQAEVQKLLDEARLHIGELQK